MKNEEQIIEDIITRNGGKVLEHYSLVSNYGTVFELNGKRHDARHWLNCYGAEVNHWGVTPTNEAIEKELNEKCR